MSVSVCGNGCGGEWVCVGMCVGRCVGNECVSVWGMGVCVYDCVCVGMGVFVLVCVCVCV